MLGIENTSIKLKLMLLVMLAVVTAMSLSSTVFIVNNVRQMRVEMIRQLVALTEVLGSNATAALTFDDEQTATELLSSLRVQPMITAAVLFDKSGKVFATYPTGAAPKDLTAPPRNVGHQFIGGHLQVMSPINQNDERIGTICIRGDTAVFRRDLIRYATIAGVVMLVSIAAAYVLASRLQGVISTPILALAQTAQQVSQNGDYSIRVKKTSNDELGILYDEFNRMLEQVETSKQALQEAHGKLEARVVERTAQLSGANHELSKEVAERLRAEKELERVHGELVTSARRAGMAEIATGVLHNVGNVLNSVNVSAEMLSNRLKNSKRGDLDRIVAMLQEHAPDLGEFFTNDEKGKQIPNFLKVLAEHLQAEEQSMVEECHSLTRNVGHIKTIVSTQQSYAGISGMVEPIDVNALLDDAVRLDSASFERHRIRVVRNYAALPTVLVDKQRLLQIVINLVKNAKESLMEQEERERILTIETKANLDRLIIEVSDTGVGIEKRNMTRIFSHGFTTKVKGHGFGLHRCANAATEIEGSLTAHSDGPLKGARFTLNLPLKAAAVTV
ncbi:MAG: CHASE sensor domain-containing protein [Pirellulales bacterium]